MHFLFCEQKKHTRPENPLYFASKRTHISNIIAMSGYKNTEKMCVNETAAQKKTYEELNVRINKL